MSSTVKFKETLVKHLNGGEAFMPVDEALNKIPFSELGKRPADLPYSFYELFYHIKYTQKDILDYCLHKNYSAADWPQDYWPENNSPETEVEWKNLKKKFFKERERLKALILAEETDLDAPVPSNKDHSLLREILLVIEHTSYHTGQLLIILRHLGLHSS